MIKKPKSTLDQLLMVKKKTKSSTKKNLGIGFPVICLFIVTPYPITQAYLKIWARQVRRKGGWGALAHNDYKSLD